MPRSGVKLKTVNTVIVVAFLQKKKKKTTNILLNSRPVKSDSLQRLAEAAQPSPARVGPCEMRVDMT